MKELKPLGYWFSLFEFGELEIPPLALTTIIEKYSSDAFTIDGFLSIVDEELKLDSKSCKIIEEKEIRVYTVQLEGFQPNYIHEEFELIDWITTTEPGDKFTIEVSNMRIIDYYIKKDVATHEKET